MLDKGQNKVDSGAEIRDGGYPLLPWLNQFRNSVCVYRIRSKFHCIWAFKFKVYCILQFLDQNYGCKILTSNMS